MREYVAEFHVAATSAGESTISWASDFELAPGPGDETVQNLLSTGLDNLQQQYTKKNDGAH